MRIEHIEIHNFKVLQNIKFEHIGAMGVFLGENGVGKTTLFDVFGFLKSCLTENVRSALQARGGYNEVHSCDSEGDIHILIKYRPNPKNPVCTYELSIGLNKNHEPIVNRERLSYRRGSKGTTQNFIDFVLGKGQAMINETAFKENDEKPIYEEFSLASPDILAIKSLGQMEKFKAAVEIRQFFEDWFFVDFQIDQMRLKQEISYHENLNRRGNNLANVAKYLYDNHRERFDDILKKMQERIPGVTKIDVKTTEDGGILLRFQDGRFKNPFAIKHVSDGTMKMFAYLVMLAEPNPHKLLCIEEPENQIYPLLLQILAEEFRGYAERGGQVFITTHSPDFTNALEPQELFFIKKQKNGYSTARKAADNPIIVSLYNEGEQLGYLWNEQMADYEYQQ